VRKNGGEQEDESNSTTGKKKRQRNKRLERRQDRIVKLNKLTFDFSRERESSPLESSTSKQTVSAVRSFDPFHCLIKCIALALPNALRTQAFLVSKIVATDLELLCEHFLK